MRIEHAVEFDLDAQERADGTPVNATGSSLEIRRNDRVVVLGGPATVRQGGRQVTANQISVFLDQNYRAQRAIAEGHPEIHEVDGKDKLNVSAEKFDTFLGPEGWAEKVVADGKIVGTRHTPSEMQHFSAAHAEVAMLPQGNLLKEMTATGSVVAGSQQGVNSNGLKTDSLRLTFAPLGTPNPLSRQQGVRQSIETAETLAPATLESKSGNETTNLHAQKLVAKLGPDGRLNQLFGHSGVDIRRQIGSGAPQISSAAELAAKFERGELVSLPLFGVQRFAGVSTAGKAVGIGTCCDPATTVILSGLPWATSRSQYAAMKCCIHWA